MTDTTTPAPALPLPRTAHPLGILATVLRAKYQSTGKPANGARTISVVDEFVITATADANGTLTEPPHGARPGRQNPDKPEAWLYVLDQFGRKTWAIVPAMPTTHRREPTDVRRYLGGWMASGNYARIQDPVSVIGFYGAVAIHDHREWPPVLPGTEAAHRR